MSSSGSYEKSQNRKISQSHDLTNKRECNTTYIVGAELGADVGFEVGVGVGTIEGSKNMKYTNADTKAGKTY